jgi:tetratricopeptide (TPR) repeat protein
MDCFDDGFSPDQLLYEEGRDAMSRGSLEQAISCFERSNAILPHFKTLELMGECLCLLHRWREAIVPLAAAGTLNKGVRAPSLLAQAQFEAGYYSDAVLTADLALSRDGNNRRALAVKARAQAQLRRD